MSGALAPVAQPSSEPANTPATSTFANIPADDPDVIALREAEAELRGEPAPSLPVGNAAPELPPTDTGTPPAPAVGTVPLPRFQALTADLHRHRDEALYWQGRAAALEAQMTAQNGQQSGQPAAAPPQTAQPSPTDQLRAAEAFLVDAATKWEAGGEMTAAEWETARLRGLTAIMNGRDEIFAQRIMQVVREMVDASSHRPGLLDAQALEVQVAQLEAAHPWLQVMTDQDIQALEQLAVAEAQMRNINLGTGPARTAKVRARVAQLSDRYGPEWYPGVTPPAPQAPAAAAQQPAAATQPPPLPAGQAARPSIQDVRGNLDRQAAHPPMDTTGRTTADATLTLERLDGMTIEQIEEGVPVDRLRALVGLPPRR